MSRGGLPVVEHQPAAHRQVIALVADLRERLRHLRLDPRESTSLADLHGPALDAVLATVLHHGDMCRHAVETGPGEAFLVGRLFFVAVCVQCEKDAGTLEMPFDTHDKRADWCRAHSEGTGHQEWRSWETVR